MPEVLFASDLGQSVQRVLSISALSENEEQLKVGIESELRTLCERLGIFWNPYTLEKSLLGGKRRLDVVHGCVIIEYEPPQSFKGREGRALSHAQDQLEEYATILSYEEGRGIEAYQTVAWDGTSLSFGRFRSGTGWLWEGLVPFDGVALRRLIEAIARGGRPLVSASLLRDAVGPNSHVGGVLLPALFNAAVRATEKKGTGRASLIFSEWSRLFGEVSGDNTSSLVKHLDVIGREHAVDYSSHPQEYVFALSTYIAIVAKVTTAFSLLDPDRLAHVSSLSSSKLFSQIERGVLFRNFGIANMLDADFFSWYVDEIDSTGMTTGLEALVEQFLSIDFDVTKKSPASLRDLFKGMYMGFAPKALRHALGEYYTPDWLAAHVLDESGWKTSMSSLDPTCGSGTFLLEMLKRRIDDDSDAGAQELLEGIHGFDLNPLAVLMAKASMAVLLAGRFDSANPVLLPVFLADAINVAVETDGVFVHGLLTERGEKRFAIPASVVRDKGFHATMLQLQSLVDSGMDASCAMRALERQQPCVRALSEGHRAILRKTVSELVELKRAEWDGIWCPILFDRFAAASISPVDMVVGNPPWVKWSNLPSAYASFIKPICDTMDIFSEDVWVGGIQSDMSTVVTYRVLERFVREGGFLSFLITGTVFKNESSQGFRRWVLKDSTGKKVDDLRVILVEDYRELRPFEGAANWPTLMVIRRSEKNVYPVPYRRYRPKGRRPVISTLSTIDDIASMVDVEEHVAMPVVDEEAGPWMDGNPDQISLWRRLVRRSAKTKGGYSARKGVTTDANGIFFVDVAPSAIQGLVRVANDPARGRLNDIAPLPSDIEPDYLFPLLRGRDIRPFDATPEPGRGILVPQAGISGDEDLPVSAPRTFGYLSEFKDVLERRSSYRRFQRGKPFWSVWSTGSYTFSRYKVVWKEMSGSSFCAAYVSTAELPGVGERVVVPDHKVYFVPLDSEKEAAYLTAVLNSDLVRSVVNGYMSGLSLGTSVTDYLNIPRFDPSNRDMTELANLGMMVTRGRLSSDVSEKQRNLLVEKILL